MRRFPLQFTLLFAFALAALTAPTVAQVYDGHFGNVLVRGQAYVGAARANKIMITGAAAGSNPGVTVTGTDTNIGYNLTPKGTGLVTVSTGVSAAEFNPPDTLQTLAAAATMAVTPGKNYFTVAGSGGAVTLSTTVPIAAGTVVGQSIIVQGTSNTNTVTITVNQTSNVKATNAATTRVLGLEDVEHLIWDGTNWVELSFNNNL